ncbi:toxin C-terminal domain-containing protein [Streptococcus pluranimalium]
MNFLRVGNLSLKIKKKKPRYISPDRDGHGGGVWKGADKLDDIRSDTTRKGTYDKDLNKIDD